MKTVIKILVVMFLLNVAAEVCPNKVSAQGPVSFQVFYDELSPYGEWMMYPNYGYVWVPNAGPFFSPYQTAGHWAFTNYGWTWVSEYQWGWAPFHYGRWDRDPYYGWIWIPGHEWAPAWVSWRHCDGYYGWAPIAPGISLEYAYGRDYYPPQERWIFCNERYIDDPYVYNYYAPREQNRGFIERGEVIHNRHEDRERGYYYNDGPRHEDVERVTHRHVNVIQVRDSDRPGHNEDRNTLSIYRPVINRGRDKDRDNNPPMPKRITDRDAIKPERERPNVNQNREHDKPVNHGDDRNQQRGHDEPNHNEPNKVNNPEHRNEHQEAPVKPNDQPKKADETQQRGGDNKNAPPQEQQKRDNPPNMGTPANKGGGLFDNKSETQHQSQPAPGRSSQRATEKKVEKKPAKVVPPPPKEKEKPKPEEEKKNQR